MKFVKRFFATIFITAIIIMSAAVVINAKTDFFINIGRYIPALEQNYPLAAKKISDAADELQYYTSHLPTPREIYASITKTELPIDPDDVASNIYYSSDSMLNFYSNHNVSIEIIDGGKFDIYGVTHSPNEKYLVFQCLDESGEVLEQIVTSANADGLFRKIFTIPRDTHQLAIFAGSQRYGNFESMVYNYYYLSTDEQGNYIHEPSPVHAENVAAYEKIKSVSNALKSTYSVDWRNDEIKRTAQEITAPYQSNYDKAVALHDWVCKNVYYDRDSINGDYNTAPYTASDVLEQKRAVCLGYADLYAALCRAVDIPCNVVTGYALGVNSSTENTWNEKSMTDTEGNHAWNEVYLDNRWVIVDTTWDSKNVIENGKKTTDENISYMYFDANLRFFSQNHRIIEYVKK